MHTDATFLKFQVPCCWYWSYPRSSASSTGDLILMVRRGHLPINPFTFTFTTRVMILTVRPTAAGNPPIREDRNLTITKDEAGHFSFIERKRKLLLPFVNSQSFINPVSWNFDSCDNSKRANIRLIFRHFTSLDSSLFNWVLHAKSYLLKTNVFSIWSETLVKPHLLKLRLDQKIMFLIWSETLVKL